MRKGSLLHRFVLGTIIGLVLVPAQPAEAFPVIDITAYGQRIQMELHRLQEWAQTIQHYQAMFDKAVQQWTTMKGILQTVDQTLAKYKELALVANDVGQIIRGSFLIFRQYRAMITYNIKAFAQIDNRLRNGIFNPAQDLHNFEEYLQFSIGRSSQDAIAIRVQAARKDSQIALWMDQEAEIRAKIASTTQELIELRKLLDEETQTTADPVNIQHLNELIALRTKSLEDLEKSLSELREKITDRLDAYGVRIQDMENFGYQIQAVNQAWKGLNQSKDKISETMDSLILQQAH
ncbi:MAG TPA: hypothetical protein VFC63_22920 [Blastocatellia bacterium]|nr:hypothetical protein [Blastocatellia bacterium]